jgi:hypothetical protein
MSQTRKPDKWSPGTGLVRLSDYTGVSTKCGTEGARYGTTVVASDYEIQRNGLCRSVSMLPGYVSGPFRSCTARSV